jgi:hypothetical protein
VTLSRAAAEWELCTSHLGDRYPAADPSASPSAEPGRSEEAGDTALLPEQLERLTGAYFNPNTKYMRRIMVEDGNQDCEGWVRRGRHPRSEWKVPENPLQILTSERKPHWKRRGISWTVAQPPGENPAPDCRKPGRSAISEEIVGSESIALSRPTRAVRSFAVVPFPRNRERPSQQLFAISRWLNRAVELTSKQRCLSKGEKSEQRGTIPWHHSQRRVSNVAPFSTWVAVSRSAVPDRSPIFRFSLTKQIDQRIVVIL